VGGEAFHLKDVMIADPWQLFLLPQPAGKANVAWVF
jgi:hypothetical protein